MLLLKIAADYYAFGLSQYGRSYNGLDYRYGFNGKEKDQNNEWGSQTNYDHGARIYNPAIARWLSVDPKSAKYPNYSPYQGIGNNPIIYSDPDGEDFIIRIGWEVGFVQVIRGTPVVTYRPVINVTVTGSILDASSEDWNVKGLISKIESNGKSWLSGTVNLDKINYEDLTAMSVSVDPVPDDGLYEVLTNGEATINFNFQLKEATSLQEVDKHDHLFVLADFVQARQDYNTGNYYHPKSRGITIMNGGKTAVVDGTNTSNNQKMSKIIIHEFWSHMAKAQFGHTGGILSNPSGGDVLSENFFLSRSNTIVNNNERFLFLNSLVKRENNIGPPFYVNAAGLKALFNKVSKNTMEITDKEKQIRPATNANGNTINLHDAGVRNVDAPVINKGVHDQKGGG